MGSTSQLQLFLVDINCKPPELSQAYMKFRIKNELALGRYVNYKISINHTNCDCVKWERLAMTKIILMFQTFLYPLQKFHSLC